MMLVALCFSWLLYLFCYMFEYRLDFSIFIVNIVSGVGSVFLLLCCCSLLFVGSVCVLLYVSM